MGSINITGRVRSVSGGIEQAQLVSLVIGDVNVRSVEHTLRSTDYVDVDLGLTAEVTEALFLHMHLPETVQVRLTFTGGDTAVMRMKGQQVMTFAPGGGLTKLEVRLVNVEDQNRSVYVTTAALRPDSSTPAFWA